MESGTPVIVSNSSSLPEVAGEAGLLPEPLDETHSRNAIRKVLSDASLQEVKIKKGNQRCRLCKYSGNLFK